MKRPSILLPSVLLACIALTDGASGQGVSSRRVVPVGPASQQVPVTSRPAAPEDQGSDVVKSRNADGEGNPLPGATLSQDSRSGSIDASDLPPADAPDSIGSYFYLQHRGGGQVGQPLPYTVLGAFYPVSVPDGILFTSGQFLLDNDGNPGGGLSIGRRWFLPDPSYIFGLNGSFDLHETRFQNTQHQVVLGVEARSDRWDLFANGYLPTSRRSQGTAMTMMGPVRFAGNNLVADAMDMQETALSGVDVELARRWFGQNLWSYGGWYHLQGGGDRIDGFQAGLRGYLSNRSAFDVAVTQDPVFDTNVMFQVSGFFGGSSQGRVSPTDIRTQMGEPLRRRNTVAVRESFANNGPVVLTAGGNPITVDHVNDTGVPGNSGVPNNPLGSLTEADASTADILYVHADSTFNGQQITLAPGQSLLGEGNNVSHQVMTDQLGMVALPRVTGGVAVPVIANSAGNAISLAPGSTVAGFLIQNAAGAGIFADNSVTGAISVANTRIDGGGGIQFVNSSANFHLTNIEVVNPVGGAIALSNLTGSVALQGGFINGGPGPGIAAQNVDVLFVQGFDITGTGGQPIVIVASGNNSVHATIEGNVLLGNANASFFGFGANTGAILNLNLLGNEDQIGYELTRDVNGQIRLGGSLGLGGSFNDDNGNLTANGNTTGGGPANIIVSGAGNQIQIVDPATILVP